MVDIENNLLEDEIFGEEEQSSENSESDTIRDETDDVDNIYDNDHKIGIIHTDIVCDGGKGLYELTKVKVDNTPDFSQYRSNNSRVSNNEYLSKLEEAGAALIMLDDGDLMLRSSLHGDFKKITEEKAGRVISKLIGEFVTVGKGTKDKPPEIKHEDLMLVSETDIDTTVMSEFYQGGNTYIQNMFKPNELMMLDKNTPYNKPVTILKLILHLVNYNSKRFDYILNWLAHMFVFLDKAQVAIVLRGTQGSGKGLLFMLISLLFGKKYCFTVGNKTLKSQFLGSVFENKLFININEMSHDLKSNKELKNSLKELITDSEFAGEKKYENITKPIKLNAQMLITSNEAYILEVEPEDRRLSVFSTSGNLSHEDCNFFGYGDFKVFKKQLESELKDFALYLKNYPLDTKLANKALDTREKRALIKGTNDRFKLFVNILVNRDILSLDPLKRTNSILYAKVALGFKRGRIYQSDISPTFRALNSNDFSISSEALIDKLEIYEPTKFSRELRKKSSDLYFNL